MCNGGEAVALLFDLHFLRQVPDADHQHSDVADPVGGACPFDWNEGPRSYHMELLSRGNWMTAS